MDKSYTWKPIELWRFKGHQTYLKDAFAEVRANLSQADWLAFNEQAAREWSIETGQIENAFHIDREATMQLIREGFIASLIGHQKNGLSGDEVHAILIDTKDALEGLFAFVKSEQPLSTSYIRQLHQQLMRSVDFYEAYYFDPTTNERKPTRPKLEKGRYKLAPNNPFREDGAFHEYCPPEQVPWQMDELVKLYAELERLQVQPEVRAAWLHHAFTQIHPFQDGNGRVARALASLVLLKDGLPALTVVRTMKIRYIRALERADVGDALPLVDFVETCLYRQVVGLWREIKPTENVSRELESGSGLDTILEAAKNTLLAKRGFPSDSWQYANRVLAMLRELTHAELGAISSELDRKFSGVFPQTSFRVLSSTDSSVAYRLARIEQWGDESVANGYTNELETMLLNTGAEASIVVTFDPLSGRRVGICGVAVRFSLGTATEISEPSFLFNFCELNPTERFRHWLDGALEQALAAWQRELAK